MSTIAFDLDGTLIDSVEHIHAAVSAGLSDLGLAPITHDDTRSFVGHGLPPLIEKVLGHLEEPAARHAELSARVMAHYTAIPNDPASVYPGVPAALETLSAAGHRLTICTNKPREAAMAALRDTGLLPYFDLVIGGDSLSTRKPDPAPLFAAISGDHAMFVGDSEVDSGTAKAANLPFALFTEGYRKSPVSDLPHTASFSHFRALPEIVTDLMP